MSSSSGAGETLTSPTEQQANAMVATVMEAKLMVATGSGDVQQLKDLVNKQEQDSKMMLVVMAKQQAAAASAEKHHHQQQGNMDPHLLALASSGSPEGLDTLLYGQASGVLTSLPLLDRLRLRDSGLIYGDTEANESILEGVTAEGDTALHVVAAYCQGDGDNFKNSARIINGKAKHLLFVQNNNGDTPLHCAARAGKSNMVKYFICLAADEGESRVKELLRKENKHKETALHEAIRVGNKEIFDLLINKDSELASVPEDGGTSPMYLAIMLRRDEIEETLYEKYENSGNGGKLSFSGPNGQNALYAAVLRYADGHQDLMQLLDWNKTHLCPQNKDLTTQRDENGSTPLHFAAATQLLLLPSTVCQQVLEANPDALFQPDNAGFFPIHVAASVGAYHNIDMFVKKCPGSAGLRDAKGRTFLHVAVEKRKEKVIKSACRNPSLSWIMNMVDNDGNTAVHLAVEAGSLHMFCPLLANPQVNLNLPNNMGETPFDIAEYKNPNDGRELILYNAMNSEPQIQLALLIDCITGPAKGVRRPDELLEDNKAVRRVKQARDGKSKETEELLKDSTGILSVGSVLIAAATFGANFAMPGGYIADDHSNGGSPVLARRYAFEGFIVSNTLAFVFSMVATTALMCSGSPLFDTRSRIRHLYAASYFLSLSVTSLAAAFALGAYVVLAPVSHKTAVATCVITSLVLLYKRLEFTVRYFFLIIPSLGARKGLIGASALSALVIFVNIVHHDWPLIFIFAWAAHAN